MPDDPRKKLYGPEDVAPRQARGPSTKPCPEVSKGQDDTDDRIVSAEDTLEDEVYGASLRPRTFDEYVGQNTVVENLKISIDAAKRRDEPLEHILFYGPPGLGKTTLAALIARDLGRSMRPTSGPTLEKPKDLVGILTSL